MNAKNQVVKRGFLSAASHKSSPFRSGPLNSGGKGLIGTGYRCRAMSEQICVTCSSRRGGPGEQAVVTSFGLLVLGKCLASSIVEVFRRRSFSFFGIDGWGISCRGCKLEPGSNGTSHIDPSQRNQFSRSRPEPGQLAAVVGDQRACLAQGMGRKSCRESRIGVPGVPVSAPQVRHRPQAARSLKGMKCGEGLETSPGLRLRAEPL